MKFLIALAAESDTLRIPVNDLMSEVNLWVNFFAICPMLFALIFLVSLRNAEDRGLALIRGGLALLCIGVSVYFSTAYGISKGFDEDFEERVETAFGGRVNPAQAEEVISEDSSIELHGAYVLFRVDESLVLTELDE